MVTSLGVYGLNDFEDIVYRTYSVYSHAGDYLY